MSTETRPLVEITQEALQILYREMGVVNTVRFLNQFSMGYGDYITERDTMFADTTLPELVAQIKQRRAAKEESVSMRAPSASDE
jgi:hypothetical protein